MKFKNDAAFIRNKLWSASSRKCAELNMESQISRRHWPFSSPAGNGLSWNSGSWKAASSLGPPPPLPQVPGIHKTRLCILNQQNCGFGEEAMLEEGEDVTLSLSRVSANERAGNSHAWKLYNYSLGPLRWLRG